MRCSEVKIPFNRVAEVYDRTRGLPQHVMLKLREIMTRELGRHRTVLDVGVGTGRFARLLLDSRFEVFGVDISRRMLGKAVEKGVGNLVLGDACFLPFRDKSFDVAVCIGVLHLIREWNKPLQEICRVTRNVMVSRFYVHKNPMAEATSRLVKKYGYSRRIGRAEWELESLVTPSRSVFVASYETKADETLAHLSERAYSYQWRIPEDVNKRIVDQLKNRFAGNTFRQELRLLVWDIDSLKAFCEEVAV